MREGGCYERREKGYHEKGAIGGDGVVVVPPDIRLLDGLPSLSVGSPVIELRLGAPPLFPTTTVVVRKKRGKCMFLIKGG